MKEPVTSDEKLDFLVNDAKESEKIYEEAVTRENTSKLLAIGFVAFLSLCLVAMVAFDVGYNAGYTKAIADLTQKLILKQFGIDI